MSNNQPEMNVNGNEGYTPRQLQSAFQPLPEINASEIQQQQTNIQSEHTQTNVIRAEATPFVSALFKPTSVSTGGLVTIIDIPETPVTNPLIFDLKKYKYDYFLSKLSCTFDREFAKFSSPSGISKLNDDRLLVSNFDIDTVLLFDISGKVHQVYRHLSTPKDVLYYSSNPCQAVVATRKELVILDLNTKQVVVKSDLKGFYPWNIQYIKEANILAACDPSGERIVFFDKNLEKVGEISVKEANADPSKGYQKIYPYATYFFPDDTFYTLISHDEQYQIREYHAPTTAKTKVFNLPLQFQSFSIYGDSKKNCLIADKANRRLLCIDSNSNVEEFKWKSIVEPYSMTFLSNGTLCVTDRNKAFGTNGGLAILSENDLQANK